MDSRGQDHVCRAIFTLLELNFVQLKVHATHVVNGQEGMSYTNKPTSRCRHDPRRTWLSICRLHTLLLQPRSWPGLLEILVLPISRQASARLRPASSGLLRSRRHTRLVPLQPLKHREYLDAIVCLHLASSITALRQAHDERHQIRVCIRVSWMWIWMQ